MPGFRGLVGNACVVWEPLNGGRGQECNGAAAMRTVRRREAYTRAQREGQNNSTNTPPPGFGLFFLFSFRLGCCDSCFLSFSSFLSINPPPPYQLPPQPTPTPSSARAQPTRSGPEAPCGQGVSGGGSGTYTLLLVLGIDLRGPEGHLA